MPDGRDPLRNGGLQRRALGGLYQKPHPVTTAHPRDGRRCRAIDHGTHRAQRAIIARKPRAQIKGSRGIITLDDDACEPPIRGHARCLPLGGLGAPKPFLIA